MWSVPPKKARALSIAPLAFLAACHADVTFRADLHRDGTALLSAREILDDELYALAFSQETRGDPFGVRRLQREGWTLTSVSDARGNHIITLSKQVDARDLGGRDAVAPVLRGTPLRYGAIRFARAPGLLFEQDSLAATIPPLLPLALSRMNGLYAGAASSLAASVVSAHLELKAPGRVTATNGTMMPDGAVRWDLDLQGPTEVRYSVRMVNLGHVAAAVVAVSILILAVSARRRRVA